MTNPNYAANQTENQTTPRRTVKIGFNKAFTDANLVDMIKRTVALTTPVLQHAHLLANLHVLRMCEAGLQLPKLDTTFWNRCSAVSTATGGSFRYNPNKDPELTTSLALYDNSYPPNFAKPVRPAFIKDVSFSCTWLAMTRGCKMSHERRRDYICTPVAARLRQTGFNVQLSS